MESLGLRLLDNWMKYKWPVGFKGYFLMQQQKTAKQQQLGVGSPKPVDGKFSLSRDFSLPCHPLEGLELGKKAWIMVGKVKRNRMVGLAWSSPEWLIYCSNRQPYPEKGLSLWEFRGLARLHLTTILSLVLRQFCKVSAQDLAIKEAFGNTDQLVNHVNSLHVQPRLHKKDKDENHKETYFSH